MSFKTVEAAIALPVSAAAIWGSLPHVLTILSIIWVLVRLAQEPLVQRTVSKAFTALGVTLTWLEQLRGLWDRFTNIWRP